jgi:hypothetical protein
LRTADLEVERELYGAARASALAWSPDGARLAASSQQRDLVLWDPAQTQPVCLLRPPPGAPLGLSIGWSGERILCGGGGVLLQAFETSLAPEARRSRELSARAWARMQALSADHPTSVDLEAALRADACPEPVRARALAANRALGDNANALNSYAWALVSRPHGARGDYLRGRKAAERAAALRPESWGIANTLAVARLRLGELERCLADVATCQVLRAKEGLGPHPADVAVEALALAGLGREGEARERLAAARALAAEPAWAADEDARAFVAEAAAGIGG